MTNKVYSCAEAINHLTRVSGNSDIVYITLSTKCKGQQGYSELVSLLDADGLSDGLVQGYYLIEPDTDTTLGQKVFVSFEQPIEVRDQQSGETTFISNVTPDIILTVEAKAGDTFDISAFWELNDNSDGGKFKGVVWQDDNTLTDTMSHTYDDDYTGKIRIYNYSIRKATGVTPSTAGCKNRITDIEFVKPQVIEDGRFLFGDMYDDSLNVGLRTIKGSMYFSETYESASILQMFYNCKALTSLKDFTLNASSDKPIYMTVAFMNSSVDDKMIQEFKIVGFKKESILSYSQAFPCTKITHINNKFVGKNATNFYSAFEGTPVTYLPAGILDKCLRGTRAFAASQLSSMSPNVSLGNLIRGSEMFSACPMSYTLSKQLYNTLPQASGAVMPSNRNDDLDYYITFACVLGEQQKIAKSFGIPAINPHTNVQWKGGFNIPKAQHGQFWLSPKGWYITFAHN